MFRNITSVPTSDIGRRIRGLPGRGRAYASRSSTATATRMWLEPRRKLGETARRPKMRGRGSPNTLRHTISTHLHAYGRPRGADRHGRRARRRGHQQAQLSPPKARVSQGIHRWGSRRFGAKSASYTTAHLRSHCDPKVVDFGLEAAAARKTRRLRKTEELGWWSRGGSNPRPSQCHCEATRCSGSFLRRSIDPPTVNSPRTSCNMRSRCDPNLWRLSEPRGSAVSAMN
jgi:hypothetical protein